MDQVIQAVEISISPAASQELRRQAMEFLQQVKEQDTWQLGLTMFMDSPRESQILRVYALDVVNASILRRRDGSDPETLGVIQETLMKYIHSVYGPGSGEVDNAPIQNKLTQAITYLFLATYGASWSSFFDELLSITTTSNGGTLEGRQRDNLPGVVFYLRVVASVHDEIADVLVARTAQDQQRNGLLKDQIRERDVKKLIDSWKEILTVWKDKNDDIVEMTLKVMGKWVSWVNIAFVLDHDFVNFLWSLLACSGKVKEAAVDTLAEIVGKKMDSSDKFQLIEFMNFVDMLAGFLSQDPALQAGPQLDVDYAEKVAKLVDNVGSELIRCLDLMNEARDRAGVLVRKLMPSFFFCFRNEYDEVSTAVFPFATDFLAFYKKYFHARGETPPAEFVVLIPELLNAIIEKMKFDESTNWGDEDELTDEAEFHDMRKRLKILQDSLAVIDPGLVLQTLVNLVGGAFDKFSQGGSSRVDWREMDLAMYEMNAIGDLAYQDSSVYVKAENGNRMNMKAGLNSTAPAPAALFAVVTKMVESNVATYPHPAILLQYMEIANRFQNVIEAHKELIPRALETFVRGTHASHNRVRTRSWYLFQRFVKKMRPHIGDIAEGVIGAVSDLLKIKAEIPEDGDDEMSSDDLNKHDATFDSQLYLFEAVGSLSSTNTIPQEKQIALAREMMNPLFADIERHLPVAQGGSMQAIFQIHHDILALGTLARGFSDWAPGVTKTAASAPTEIVRNEFQRVAEAVLVCLERLNTYENIRDAARFAFARLVGVLGSSILPLLPRWINGLLGRSSNMGEIQLFLRLLVQVIHGFKTEIFEVLNSLLTPLLEGIFAALGKPVEGTDDQIKLSEMRREYLQFLLSILSNDLGHVFTTEANLPIFEQVIQTAELFATETADPPTQKLAFSLMNKLCSVLYNPALGNASTNQPNSTNQTPQVEFSGFADLVQRFSAACWAVPTNPSFNSKDAQAKLVLSEIGAVQKSIYLKTGDHFLSYLRDVYFPSAGAPQMLVEKYLVALQQMPEKDFKKFFKDFAQGKFSA